MLECCVRAQLCISSGGTLDFTGVPPVPPNPHLNLLLRHLQSQVLSLHQDTGKPIFLVLGFLVSGQVRSGSLGVKSRDPRHPLVGDQHPMHANTGSMPLQIQEGLGRKHQSPSSSLLPMLAPSVMPSCDTWSGSSHLTVFACWSALSFSSMCDVWYAGQRSCWA